MSPTIEERQPVCLTCPHEARCWSPDTVWNEMNGGPREPEGGRLAAITIVHRCRVCDLNMFADASHVPPGQPTPVECPRNRPEGDKYGTAYACAACVNWGATVVGSRSVDRPVRKGDKTP